jgi:hypothetical protein
MNTDKGKEMEITGQDWGCAGGGCVVASANKRRRLANGRELGNFMGGGDGRVWARLGRGIGWRPDGSG